MSANTPRDDARWTLSHRFDPRAARLADRHYNRQTIGSPQFAPPGRLLVLLTPDADALWVTSWQYPEYVKHQWKDAWNCSCFRNESAALSSTLIREAVAITRWKFGAPPADGFVTFVNAAKVRRKRDPGRCYLRAGWSRVGTTAGGLIALGLGVSSMPDAVEPIGAQTTLDVAA